MSRILILQQDMLHLDSRVATGGGLRARALGEGLARSGHEIFYSLPHDIFSLYTNEERERYSLLWHSPGNLEYAIKNAKPDIIILQWLGSYECLKGAGNIPIVIDLVAPRLLELHHRGHRLDLEVRAKTEALSMGDFFICSNQRQWYYFLPWLMLSGESDAGELLKIVPVAAPLREPVGKSAEETVFVWGGVSWPWNDPLPFLNIASDEIKKSGKGRLLVLSGKFPYKYGAETKFSDWEKYLKLHSRVEILPLLPYQQMVEVYLSSSVAIDVSTDLPERRLASPFRTKDYLSCGLPLITSDFMEISPYVEEYGAGWVVEGSGREAYRNLLRSLIQAPEQVAERCVRARQLLADHFTFEKAIEPLHQFCLNPSRRKKKKSLYSAAVSLECTRMVSELPSENEALYILEHDESLTRDADALHYYKGLVFLKRGDLQSAKNEFLKEEVSFPSDISVKLKLNRIQLHEGCAPGTLLPEIENLLEQHPREENIRLELALLYHLTGANEMAETVFKEEILLFPSGVLKTYRMGSELKQRCLFSEALSYFKSVLSQQPTKPAFSSGSHFHSGEIYIKLGELERALSCFKRCIEILPAHRKAGERIEQLKGRL